jgi:translation initiation factor 2B subunit (eIF-2B alpha/beta/delta family)
MKSLRTELCSPIRPGEFVQSSHVVNPLYDYVTPDLVTLFISNM